MAATACLSRSDRRRLYAVIARALDSIEEALILLEDAERKERKAQAIRRKGR